MIEQTISPELFVPGSHLDAYETKEIAVIIVAALGFVLALGGIAVAAWAICGWRGTESISADWLHGKVSFVCRR